MGVQLAAQSQNYYMLTSDRPDQLSPLAGAGRYAHPD